MPSPHEAPPGAAAVSTDTRDVELATWHAECDRVGLPHDPAALVRHHRGNAALAVALGNLAITSTHERTLQAIEALLPSEGNSDPQTRTLTLAIREAIRAGAAQVAAANQLAGNRRADPPG